ncbi:hypothetical protein [Alteromonas sp. 14N.309.X.WAT.G.H12]|uniref:hypothetical protein n=1 Tax=Alteromonas sp. 14N.309.X.WAT.G.H12 TaxID=3120824 RepID=UPI002FD6229C
MTTISIDFKTATEELTALAKKVYPSSRWPITDDAKTPLDWLVQAMKAGLSHKQAHMLVAGKFGIPYKTASDLVGRGVWVPSGVLIKNDETFYSRALTERHFGTTKGIRLGLLLGDVTPSKYPSPLSRENEEAKDIVRGLYASFVAFTKPDCKHAHFSITSHYLSGLCGTKDVLYKRLDDSFTPLLEPPRRRASQAIGEQVWGEPCQKYSEYVNLNPTRRFSFFFGDMSEAILPSMRNHVESSSVFKVVEGIPSVASPNVVAVVDFDDITSLTGRDINMLASVHTVFTSKEKTISRLYGRMRNVIGKETLISHIAVYSSRALGTKVCQNCCEYEDVPSLLTDSIYSLSVNVKRPPVVGPGCSSCVSGYAGSILLTEDCFEPGVASGAIHAFEINQDDELGHSVKDAFKVVEALERTKKISLVLTKLEKAVTSGQLTVEDAKNLLN